MCGIAGIVSDRLDAADRVRAMRDLIAHRGPDSAGEHVAPGVALGVRRLRIIDLATGDQPMSDESGRIWTVFNGEIYNYRELRDGLIERGHVLRTSSDTEVIPHLYEEEGPRFVARLAGMFALAVWDARNRALILARDRFGKKPLLYHHGGNELVFASEHQALLHGVGATPSVDPAALRLYLQLGYVPAPIDAFRGVRKLPPAHYLVWRDASTELCRYWSLPSEVIDIDEADAIREFRRLFDIAVSRRMIADVPLGALLSGGVDSSAVVAAMARLTSRVRTFSIGFEEEDYSELPHARRIAERYGTDHHEFIVRADAMEVVPTLIRHYGEPYADSSALATYYLTKLTREHVTVALDGDGGDEVFAGYERYQAIQMASLLHHVPRPLRVAAAFGARAFPDSLSPTAPLRRVRRFLAAAPLEPTARYMRWLGVFDEASLDWLLDPAFARAARVDHGVPAMELRLDGDDPVRGAQRIDIELYLPDDLLVKMDIASMANSLEVRCPFLDHELVEFAWRLPTALKMRGRQRKYLVKRALRGVVPDENMYRRKQGFAVPVGRWMRTGLAREVEETVLSPLALGRGYFRPERLRALVRSHTEGRVDHTHRLWALLMLELWHRAFRPA